MTMTIHNIEGAAAAIVEDICRILHIVYSTTISFQSDELYDYEINIEEKEVVPFMIRFFHRIQSDEYEKIDIF